MIKLTAQAKVDPNKLLVLIQEDPHVKFSPNGVLTFPLKVQGPEVIDAIAAASRTGTSFVFGYIGGGVYAFGAKDPTSPALLILDVTSLTQ